MREEKKFVISLLIPSLFFLSFVEFAPLGYAAFYSLTDRLIFSTEFNLIGFENYVKFLGSERFVRIVLNAFEYGLTSAILQTLIGLGFALLLYNTSGKLATSMKCVLFLPYAIPYISVSLLWKFLLDPVYGPLNKWIVYLGLSKSPILFFSYPNTAMPVCIFITTWMFFPFAMIIFYAALKTVPRDLVEAAKIDGATSTQVFKYVTWPWIKRIFYITLFLRLLFNFGKFDLIWLLTQGGPIGATEIFPIVTWLTAFSEYRYGEACAIAIIALWVLIIPLLLFIYVTRKE
mgnify:FL=1